MFTRGVTKVRVSDAVSELPCWSNCLVLKEIGQILRGCSRDGTEANSRNFVLNAMCYW